jgi:hypothetical protein
LLASIIGVQLFLVIETVNACIYERVINSASLPVCAGIKDDLIGLLASALAVGLALMTGNQPPPPPPDTGETKDE